MSNNVANTTGTRREDWGTPLRLFYDLSETFDFIIDLAADELNALCDHYLCEETDIFSPEAEVEVNRALENSMFGTPYAWINPPYKSHGATGDFVIRALELTRKKDMGVVALIPASVGSNWWREAVGPHFDFFCFTPRLKFQGAPHGAQFDTALVVKLSGEDSEGYPTTVDGEIRRAAIAAALGKIGQVYTRRKANAQK